MTRDDLTTRPSSTGSTSVANPRRTRMVRELAAALQGARRTAR
jgi:hypothetical protein